MAVTIRQIAAAAGVSRGTVDRVLHDRPGVRPEIARHVRQIAEELGFEPNRAGKILAARKQPIRVGCFLPSIGNAFFADVIAGFHAAEADYADFGLSLELREAQGYEPRIHLEAIRRLAKEGCAALCLSTVDTPEIRACVDELAEAGIPVVAVNTDLTKTKRLCYVGCDYRKAGRTAAGLLALMAHERLNLLIVTGSMNVKGHNQRVQGFSRALREKNTAYEVIDVYESLDNDEHAYRMTMEALRLHPETNCIYIVAAGVSGVCRAVVEMGRQKELRILCHDEVEATRRLMRDGVIDFTIGQEPWKQGYCSVQTLFDYFMDDKRTVPKDVITGTVIKIQENLD